ncbi:MAG: efflux RND transporter periplasmic adaptor subunit [Psychromonas sp.]|nr:efflux RND transporter periplasmic adaptor subunit [Psychromonas sp.]
MFARLCRYFSLRPYWIALLITGLLVCWMLLKPTDTALANEPQKAAKEESLPKVQTTHFIPQKITKLLTLYGRSEAHSRAVIRAEVAGKIVAIATEKGRYVGAGTKLVDIEKSELPQRLAQAEALLAERLLNYKAVKSLNEKGLQDRARLAEVNSLLLAAQTEVKQLQLQLLRTEVVAPFAGILQEQFAEKGDYLQVGDAIFSLENIDPIIIRGDATEHSINHVKLGQSVSAELLSGENVSGKVSYISSQADPQSSTFRIEAEFPNPDFKILSGMSAKLSIPLYPVEAIYVSPSALAMDEQGSLGIKSVDDGVVVFKAINLVEVDNGGAWLSGFTKPVDIITLGQGFVKAGDHVQAIAVGK